VDELYRAREPLYRETSNLRIDSSHLTHRQTAEAVLAQLQQQQAQQ
jgi:shikimate kinase